jgi:hypothetical protein
LAGAYDWPTFEGFISEAIAMRAVKNRLVSAAIAIALSSSIGLAQAAENYYFRLRPSVSILNQDPFSVRIDGDKAGVIGSSFSAKAEASAPRETLRFSVADGDLPPGVSLDPASGSITGQPSQRGRFMATLKAEDAFSSASAALAITVYDTLAIEQTVVEYATVGTPYSAASFNALGGDQNYSWTLSGTLPPGLNFGNVSSPTATLSGTPTAAGSWGGLRASVIDGADHSATGLPFSIAVADPLTLSGVPALIGTVGEFYSTSFSSTGGHNPISWSLTPPIPIDAGIAFTDGVISGTPAKAQTLTGLVVRVTDKAGNTKVSPPFSIAISQPLSLAGAPATFATIGTAYSASFTATGGSGGNIWSVNSGTVPPGLTFANGSITGAPTTPGTWDNIVVGVVDSNGRSAQSAPFSIAVSTVLAVAGTPDPIGTVGTPYSAAFAVSGGDGNYTWTIVGGTLPPGLNLANGSISGTPSAAGAASNIAVRVTDGNGRTAQSDPFSISVSQPLNLVGSAPALGTIGTAYGATFTASGGNGSNQWSVVSGSLPDGLVLTNGVISGAPTRAGTFGSIVIRVTDGIRTKQTDPFSITVHNALAVSGSAPNGTVGVGYGGYFSASGGDGNYTWSVVSGSLPNGLGLSGGTIYGTPTTSSTWGSIILRVTDGAGRIAQTGAFAIYIAPPPVTPGSAGWGPTTVSFLVPQYNTLTIDLYGAGGGGGNSPGMYYGAPYGNGENGGHTYIPELGLYGTGGGVGYDWQGGYTRGAQGPHGYGINGDGNITAGGAGGGAGADFLGYGPGPGGNGGRAYKTYYRGSGPAPGTYITIVVGSGGAPGYFYDYYRGIVSGGYGGNGALYISWN